MTRPDFDDTGTAFKRFSNRELYESYFLFKSIGVNALVKVGTKLVTTALKWQVPIAPIVKPTIFRQFCGGVSAEDCRAVVKSMGAHGVMSILDYSVEAASNTEAMTNTMKEIVHSLREAASSEHIAMGVVKLTGIIEAELLDKASSGDRFSASEEESWEAGVERLDKVCAAAVAADVPLLIDAEESWIQPAIDRLSYQMMEEYNRDDVIIYNTFQMYCTRSSEELRAAHARAQSGNYKLGAKLVRGAYMEKERDRALHRGEESPIHVDKEATDRAFDEAVQYCLENIGQISLFVGTHNESSTVACIDGMSRLGIAVDDERVLFSQLYGMSDNLSFNLAKNGYRAAKYLPYGPVKSVLPYLFRRAQENTSVQDQSGRELELIRQELERRGLPH